MSFKSVLWISTICVLIAGCASNPSNSDRSESDNSSKVAKSRNTDNVENTASGNTIVCKMRRPTGSRIPEKQCMTADAWDRIADASQRARDKLNKPAYNSINDD